jgi:aryl-alcohol dehydrogenase-like predicted oxidoreductase
MQTYSLGQFTVGRVGFGAMQLPGPGVFGPPRDRDQALAVLKRAIELGINHIDTAQFYGPDVANELIREALHPYPANLALVSKVGGVRDEQANWVPAQQPGELRQQIEDNLRTLATDRLAAVNLRVFAGEGPNAPAVVEDRELFDRQLSAMIKARDEGLIAGIGLSSISLEHLQIALDRTEIVTVQNAYNLADRTSQPLLDVCTEHGISFVPFFPLGSAFTGGPAKLAADPAVARIAAKHDATPSQVALAWLLHRGEHILLIPGTSSIAHLEENLAAEDVALDADDLAALEDVRPAGDPLQAGAS